MSEVIIVKLGKGIILISDCSDGLHIRAMCLYLKCWVKNVGYNKDAVLSSRKTCLYYLIVRNLIASALNQVMGIQGAGGRTDKWPLRKLGPWRNRIPGLKVFFAPVHWIS